jgi:hypothetical protein
MPRFLPLIALLSLPVTLLGASFPPVLTAPLPLTRSLYTGAVDGQMGPMAASAGDVVLVVWRDQRRTSMSTLGARVSPEGGVADALGILIADNSAPKSVGFDGQVFRVLITSDSVYRIVMVGRDGHVESDLSVDLPASYRFLASTADGDRHLFTTFSYTENAAVVRIAIVDGHGQIVAKGVDLPGLAGATAIAGSRGDEFLVVRGSPMIAERIAADGHVLSSRGTGVPAAFSESDVVVGDAHGYLFVKQSDVRSPGAIATFKLDENGVFTGSRDVITGPDPSQSLGPAHVRWDGDRYVITAVAGPVVGHSFTYIGELKAGEWIVRTIADHVGVAASALSIRAGSRTVVFTAVNRLFTSSNYDVLVQSDSGGFFSDPQLVTYAATLQTNVAVVAGHHGYLAGWAENGPDRFTRLYIARLSPSGMIQEMPIEVARTEQSFYDVNMLQVQLASNGDTYVVVWWRGLLGSLAARRLSADTGRWLDPEPLEVGVGGFPVVASNGRDAVVIFRGVDGLTARRIVLSGQPAMSAPVLLGTSRDVYWPSIAWNGTDYVVAWSEGFRDCFIECALLPFRLLALRMRDDGTVVDKTPFVIDDRGYADKPSVSCQGAACIVAWLDLERTYGSRITSEGSVIEKAVLDDATTDTAPLLVADGDTFILFSRHTNHHDIFDRAAWTAVAFENDTPLDHVSALPRVAITDSGDRYMSLSAATRDGILAVAFDEPAGAVEGWISRAFIKFFGELPRRRAAGR